MKISVKILVIIQFILVIFNEIVLLSTPPATSYEFSMYAAYPVLFWIAIICSFVIGQILVSGRNIVPRFIKVFSIMGLIISTSLILLMPIFRGYFIYGRGDPTTHIGYIKDILRTGHISAGYRPDFYPVLHILGATLKIISNTPTPIELQTIYLPFIFYIFIFIPGYYLLMKFLLNFNFDDRFLTMSLVILPIFGTFQMRLQPHMLSFYLLPITIYTIFSIQRNNNFKIIAILYLIVLVFFHPITSAYLLGILLVLLIYEKLFIKHNKKFLNSIKHMLVLFGITWIGWYMWYLVVLKGAIDVIISILIGEQNYAFKVYSLMLSKYSIQIEDIIKVIFYRYGTYIVLGTGGIIWILKHLRIKGCSVYDDRLGFFALMLLMFGSWSVFNIFLKFVNFYRAFKFVPLFSIPLVSNGIKNLMYRNKSKIKTVLFIFVFLIVIDYFSIFAVYPSFESKIPNQQISQAEYTGMKAFFNFRDTDFMVFDINMFPMRFCHAIMGVANKNCYLNIKWYTHVSSPPDHFGYSASTSKIKNYTSYLVYSSLGKNIYQVLYPKYRKYWKYNYTDYFRLYTDFRVSLVYNNGDLVVHKIDNTWW